MHLALKLDVIVELFKNNFNASKSNIQIAWNQENIVVARQKLAFCHTAGTIFVTAVLLAMAPEKLPLWYTVLWLCHMSLQVVSFYRQGYHYFFSDLCHWVNLLVIPMPKKTNRSLSCFSGYFHHRPFCSSGCFISPTALWHGQSLLLDASSYFIRCILLEPRF